MVISSTGLEHLTAIKDLMTQQQAKIMVVSDFDHTLTKFTSLQCHDIVGYNKHYPSDFAQEFDSIFMRPNSSLAAWWTEAHDLITNKSGLTKAMLQEHLDEVVVAVRDGLTDFAVSLRLHRVPLVIVSAGIKDVIAHTLSSCNIPTDADHLFHIDANYLEFHASGNIADILPKDPVHSESKKHVTTRAPHMFAFLSAATAAAADQLETDVTVTSTSELEPVPLERNTSSSSSASKSTEHVFRMRSADNSVFLMEPTDENTSFSDAVNNCTTIETVAQSNTESAADTLSAPVVAIVMGDRPADFAVLENYPQVVTFRVGFARSRAGRDVELLLKDGGCHVIFVGEEHGLESVHKMVDELIHLRNTAAHASTM